MSVFAALVSVAVILAAQSLPDPAPGEARLEIFVKGRQVGVERVTVTKLDRGWTIVASGSVAAPAELVTRKFEARYDADWRPMELTIEATIQGTELRLHTLFNATSALSEIRQGDKTTTKADTVATDTIVLPNNFFAGYEALAIRLRSAQPGREFPVYVAPQAEVRARLVETSREQLQTAARTIAAYRHRLSFQNVGGTLDADLWSDETGRLLRVSLPAASLEAIREDLASVAARTQLVTRAGDEDVMIPAAGFSLAATISKPPNQASRLAAIVLVAGSGAQDRDETVAGIPLFGQLAGALADAGFLVVRYDKRGVGQSGGRLETATLADYADDALAVVESLRRRKDVDRKRVAIVGHSEGGAVALIAGRKKDDIAGLVLVATPGTTGADLVLEQQRHALESMSIPDTEKQAKTELQKKIHAAVITGTGWEGIPPPLRRQADTAWFRSLLMFDPAAVMPKVRQPILIVQGALDRQVPSHHAERLAELARSRKNKAPVELTIAPGINHLLVRATTGEVSEYGSLKERRVSNVVIDAIRDWVVRTLAGDLGRGSAARPGVR